MKDLRRLSAHLLLCLCAGFLLTMQAGASEANQLTYLDGTDPFYVGLEFPKLTTPQWIGEPGVEAVIILAVDDMTESGRYEAFLRPILERLKRIDGQAPLCIMTRSIPVGDPQVHTWLTEGLSLEAHTLKHPCPLLANGDFAAAAATYHDCVDLLSQVPGNQPVAFRMPCCDSMNSPSPRFYSEIFNRTSPQGHFLTIDSSVMNLPTTNDSALPRELVLDSDGQERFRKYFPVQTNASTRVSLGNFATTIENYPYPYVIDRVCWEFPCAVPSDWEAYNLHGPTNRLTVADWKAGLEAAVTKQGVFTMIFHPHGWIRSDQIVELIDYAVQKYGSRIRFLTFREAQERLNRNLLNGQPLRAADGSDNGVRLLDLNHDGFLDVVMGNPKQRMTRLWNPTTGSWVETDFPTTLVTGEGEPARREAGVKFGFLGATGQVVAFFRNELSKGAWTFSGDNWQEVSGFFSGLMLQGQPVLTSEGGRDRGVRLRDVDHDGRCELLVGNDHQNAVFAWNETQPGWKKLPYSLPDGAAIVTETGADNGLRFVDVNNDGHDDVLVSNEKGYSLHLFIAQAKPWLGWDVGWSYRLRAGQPGQGRAIPIMVRGGAHPNNGAWFHGQQLFVQNEDTSGLADKVQRVSFQELQLPDETSPKTPAEVLSSFRVAEGFKIEVVASEPQVIDPVAFDWGPDGRLWVVEMRDYPLGMDGKGQPGGVIRVLEDTKGTGFYDKSTVFLEGLRFPNGIMPWGKGVLISAAPDILYVEDPGPGGKGGHPKLLFTGFRQGNQQHRINGFEYGLDNWIYAANGGSGGVVRSVAKGLEFDLRGHDLRFRPDDGSMELQPGPTQYGRHRNDWGDWFGNDNSRWLWHYFLPEHYLRRNPHLAVTSTMRLLPAGPDTGRVFALGQPQQRFNWPTHLFEVTSACSAMPYRDDLFGPEFDTSIFICEPANNVVHREVLEADGVSFVSHRSVNETNSEFLSSTDHWFRPVMAKTGPDGALYVADMYRMIIEHPEYFPDELKHRPDLRAGEDKGRIYRIYPSNTSLRKGPRLDQLSTGELVAALDSPNGWQRDTVQRLLVESKDHGAVPGLESLAQRSANPKVRLQALATLDGLGAVTDQGLKTALQDAHYAVRREAVRLSETRVAQSPDLAASVLALQDDPDVRVRYQLAFSLGELATPEAGNALGAIALMDWADEAMQTAVLSSAPNHLDSLLSVVLSAAKTQPMAPSLMERLVRLTVEMAQQRLIASTLHQIAEPFGAQYQDWQMAGLVGFLDAVEEERTTVDVFASRTGGDVERAVATLGPLFVQARRLSADSQASESGRVIAVRLLGRHTATADEDVAVLVNLLGAENPVPIHQAALVGLRRLQSEKVPQLLLQRWRGAAPTERQEILNTVFSRESWVTSLLAALESGQLSPSELGPLQRQTLLTYGTPEIRQRAGQLFATINSDRQKVLERYKGVADLTGNREHGRSLFAQNCSICHRVKGDGHRIGPDLETVANKPVPELVVAILDPNQAVDPIYTGYNVSTKDDRDLSGILVSETPNSITLRQPGGAEEILLRGNIKAVIGSGRSLMPEGFETGLSPQDLADLISFILGASEGSAQ